MKKIGSEIAKKQFDIINCHNFPSEWGAYFAKKRLKIPILWMCNEPPFWFYQEKNFLRKVINFPLYFFFDKFVVKYVDKIIVLDYLNKGRVQKAYRRDAEVIRSGLDISKLKIRRLDSEKIRREHNIGNSFMLLNVTGFLDFKRPQDSINACDILIKKGIDVKLVIIGIGPLMQECKKLVKDLNIEDKVIFVGKGVSSKLPEYYNACNALIFPAEQTWGLVVIEAMACKKPVIVSDKSGVSEIIENGKNGFVVPSRQPEKIAEKVELLIKDRGLYKRIADSSYEYISKNISWEKYARNMERVFKETIKGENRSS